MSKLNQIIAVVNGKKTKVNREVTEVYKKIQKSTLFEGVNRVYHPLDDEASETFPPETKNIQYSVHQSISDLSASLAELFDVVATQDWANTKAVADVVVDGETILKDVPVTHLLFLEKQLNDVQTFVTHLPTLDPAEDWVWSDNTNCYITPVAARTNKTKKVMRNHVKAEATDKHPAQVETYNEDIKIGEWETTKYSGAIPLVEKNSMLERVGRLIDSVKYAREAANAIEVENVNISQSIFKYLFNPTNVA